MKIGILGSRGIPNHYGGFEQFASTLAPELVARGADVWVYTSHNHVYQKPEWKGVKLIHCYDPEIKMGAAGQFIYDFNCILDSRKREFDILLQLGYTSSAVWYWMLPKKTLVITNMDGMEWQRAKYSGLVRRFLKFAEKLAVSNSDALIGDAEPVCDYLLTTYDSPSIFIPYGAEIFNNPQPGLLKSMELEPGKYFLVIARMQPDNHIETIINGVLNAAIRLPLIIVGNDQNKYGQYLRKKFKEEQIKFLGAIYDIDLLNNLRHYCRLYFHGHSAGGTNPSLLEAMAAGSPVCAHDNKFNRSVLGKNAYYFATSGDITLLTNMQAEKEQEKTFIANNLTLIKLKYNWSKVVDEYLALFEKLLSQKNTEDMK